MENPIFTHGDVYLLMTALDQFMQRQQGSYGPATGELLSLLTTVWKSGSDFFLQPISEINDQDDFTEPDQDIVAYAQRHNIHLNLKSRLVQRVIRLRMAQEQ